jgi:hypothetical protein
VLGLLPATLRPLLDLELLPLLRLPASDRTREERGEMLVSVPGIVGDSEVGEEGGEEENGTKSQWARKCSPRTELYGLQTLPFCAHGQLGQ